MIWPAVMHHARDPLWLNSMEQAVVERLLERIITRMIDFNYHLIIGPFNLDHGL